MYYNDARELFKSGDIIGITGSNWKSISGIVANGIRLFTNSDITHVSMILVFGGRVWIVEATPPVIRIVPLSHYLDKGFYWVSMNQDLSQEELTFALSLIGDGKYSALEAIKEGLHLIKANQDNKWECAEFVIACRMRSGIDLGTLATPGAVIEKALKTKNKDLRHLVFVNQI
jgi:hypothetical protein